MFRGRTIKDIRRSLSFYSDPDAKNFQQGIIVTVFLFLLRSVCLTVEVFLHDRIGKSYITEPKALVGSLFPYLYLIIARVDIYFYPEFNPARPGGIEIAKPFLESIQRFNGTETWNRLEELWRSLTDKDVAMDTLYPVFIAIGIFGVVANLRFLENIVGEYVLRQRRHPYSSGETLFIWNPIYKVADRFNIRTDVVKQYAEPLLCIVGGWLLKTHLSGDLKFLGVWATFGGIAIFIRGFLENRKRTHLIIERLANEMNSDAFQMQDSLSNIPEDHLIPVSVRGRV